MSEDKDYKEVLSGTIEEVKGKIRDLESPDYKELLRLEKKGEDRQKLKDFLKEKIDALKGGDEETEEQESQEADESEDTEESEEEETEEHEGARKVKSSEDESIMDKLSDLSVGKLLILGGFAGLLVGLLVGYGLGPSTSAGGPGDAASSIQQLVDAGDFNGTADIGEPELRNGLYYFNVTLSQETENGTQTGYQSYYVTQDGELLFPEIAQNPFMPPVPMEIDQILAAQQQQQQDQPQPDQPAE